MAVSGRHVNENGNAALMCALIRRWEPSLPSEEACCWMNRVERGNSILIYYLHDGALITHSLRDYTFRATLQSLLRTKSFSLRGNGIKSPIAVCARARLRGRSVQPTVIALFRFISTIFPYVSLHKNKQQQSEHKISRRKLMIIHFSVCGAQKTQKIAAYQSPLFFPSRCSALSARLLFLFLLFHSPRAHRRDFVVGPRHFTQHHIHPN